MSDFSHDGQTLLLRDHVYALPEGAYLFPMDGRVHDTVNEIPILLKDNVTFRQDNKRFLGSVAIEDGTVNEVASVTSKSGMDTETPPPERSYYPKETVYHIRSGNWHGAKVTLASQVINAGEKIAISFYVYIKEPCIAKFNIQFDSNQIDNADVGFSVINANEAGWYRFEYVNTFSSAHTGASFRLENGVTGTASSSRNWSIASNECWITAIQFERKDHVTSFVPAGSSRGEANLEYDLTSLGMKDRGFVSCWIKNSYTMRNLDDWKFFFRMYAGSREIGVGTLNGGSRNLRFYTAGDSSSNLYSSILTTDFKEGEWIHLAVQWDINGLQSGELKEMYINGIQHKNGGNSEFFPTQPINRITIGQSNRYYHSNTQYEQLVIHPSKTFTAKEIELMYKSQSPMFDWRDQILFW